MTAFWKSREFIISQVLFLFFAVLAFFLRHEGLSFFDASEFATAIRGAGIPHAPGYPLYVLFGKFFYIFTGDPFLAQFWVNIFSAWLTAGFLFFSLSEDKKVALLSVSFLLAQGVFQQYILVPEVFTLNLALAAILIYCHQAFEKTRSLKWVFWIGLLYGLGVCHHHLLALMVPASAFLLGRSFFKTRLWVKGIGCFLGGLTIGLLPLAGLFVMSAQSPDYTYFSVQSFEELLFIVLRQGYGTFKMTGSASAVPVFELLKVMIEGMLVGTAYVGLIVGLLAVPGYWRNRRHSDSTVLLSVSTILIFVVLFCGLANFPLESAEGKNAFVRYLSFPSFLLLYPLAFALRWMMKRWGAWVFYGGQALAIGLAGVSLAQLNYRHYPVVEYQIKTGFESIHRVLEVKNQQENSLDPRYASCLIFTVADPLHFGGRYYNEFHAKPRCYFYSVGTVISGQFQARAEQILMQRLLGTDYPFSGKSREQIFLEFFARAIEQRYRVFFLYAGDLEFFRRPDLLVTPVGPVLELLASGGNTPSESLIREYGYYLESLKSLLDEMDKAPLQPRAPSLLSLMAPFANLSIYPQLLKVPSQYQELEREIRRRAPPL